MRYHCYRLKAEDQFGYISGWSSVITVVYTKPTTTTSRVGSQILGYDIGLILCFAAIPILWLKKHIK